MSHLYRYLAAPTEATLRMPSLRESDEQDLASGANPDRPDVPLSFRPRGTDYPYAGLRVTDLSASLILRLDVTLQTH
jgi:hypothetical protein